MYIDASALVAIIVDEPDSDALGFAMRGSKTGRVTSPVAIYEATLGVARVLACPVPRARQLVVGLLKATSISVAAIGERHADAALEAFSRFGKGYHAAKLNMGDCFAYAVAAEAALPILFKGDDFSQTDLPSALSAP
ncbi:type II toxin-antitoxin system VapC family toxin [Bosea sp. LjRoot237]|uniref:type II toxin-antitoxin system VapC family toxin n=1 Tax=Bosea sp. LjRoot237 TaxID=3342292 RepID=UPI003ED104C9